MIKGFAFDLDGIIVDTAEYHYIAWKTIAKTIGIDIDKDFNEHLKGVSREKSLKRILDYGDKANEISEKDFNDLMFRKNEHYNKLINQITKDDLLPGVLDLLKEIKNIKIPMVIASASQNAPKIIEKLNINEYFNFIINPKTLKRGKPAPDIFLKAAEILNLKPQDMVGIEDAKSGITAINSAEMFSVGVGDSLALNEADLFLESTSLLNYEIIEKEFKEKCINTTYNKL